MAHIITYPFRPISNNQQQVHLISIAERMRKGKDTVFVPHRTDFFILQIVTGGTSTHMVDFEEVELAPGDILFLVPGQVHAFREGPSYAGYLIAFEYEFLYQHRFGASFLDQADIYNHTQAALKFSFDHRSFIQVKREIAAMQRELEMPYDSYQQQKLFNILCNVLIASERVYRSQQSTEEHPISTSKQLVIRLQKLIRSQYQHHLKVKDYADQLAVSERTLQQGSMDVLGKTPKQLLSEHIILESKRLLVYEPVSIKEVSYMLGFDEPSNFTKFFKLQTGLSPSQFKVKQFQILS